MSNNKPLSLSPLKFEEALELLLKAKLEPHPPTKVKTSEAKKTRTKNQKSSGKSA